MTEENKKDVLALAGDVTAGRRLKREEEREFFKTCDLDLLTEGADRIRRHFTGDRVDLCSIISGKNGNCSENCRFCAQSAHSPTGCDVYGLLDYDTIYAEAKTNEKEGVDRFAIVISGHHPSCPDFEKIVEKAKGKGLAAVTDIIEDVFPKVKTNFTSSQLIKMASQMFNYNIENTRGFPFEHLETDLMKPDGEKIDGVFPVTLADNVSELHEFLFDDTGYVVSSKVKEYSDHIEKDCGFGADYRNAAIENGIIPDAGSEADLAK